MRNYGKYFLKLIHTCSVVIYYHFQKKKKKPLGIANVSGHHESKLKMVYFIYIYQDFLAWYEVEVELRC